MAFWTDRNGGFAPFKLAIFIAILLPAAWICLQAANGWLGPRPVTEAIHQSGDWSIRFLAATLAVTPLRRASRWSRLILVRRMLGLAALAYATLHITLYIADLHFDFVRVASEILTRLYLTIGFAAFCGLCALGVTSTDTMIRRLGSDKWNNLHRLVYAIVALATVHYFMQSKFDVTQAILIGGLFLLLLAHRLATYVWKDLSALALAGLAIATAFATALFETAWYAVSVGAPPDLVLAANFDFSLAIRPAWFVLAAGFALVIARLLRPLAAPGAPRQTRRSGALAREGRR